MFAYESCFSNSSQRPPEISVTVTTVPSASILSPGRKSVHAFAPASPCFDFVKKKKSNRYRAFGFRSSRMSVDERFPWGATETPHPVVGHARTMPGRTGFPLPNTTLAHLTFAFSLARRNDEPSDNSFNARKRKITPANLGSRPDGSPVVNLLDCTPRWRPYRNCLYETPYRISSSPPPLITYRLGYRIGNPYRLPGDRPSRRLPRTTSRFIRRPFAFVCTPKTFVVPLLFSFARFAATRSAERSTPVPLLTT